MQATSGRRGRYRSATSPPITAPIPLTPALPELAKESRPRDELGPGRDLYLPDQRAEAFAEGDRGHGG
jgi:hypothetical protein